MTNKNRSEINGDISVLESRCRGSVPIITTNIVKRGLGSQRPRSGHILGTGTSSIYLLSQVYLELSAWRSGFGNVRLLSGRSCSRVQRSTMYFCRIPPYIPPHNRGLSEVRYTRIEPLLLNCYRCTRAVASTLFPRLVYRHFIVLMPHNVKYL